ncbi:MAG: DUF1016 N-terminal domain-containing protein, partial [bacterium]
MRIRTAQIKATLSANCEMILMYWDIGRMIAERQKREGWGASVIPRLARDIRNDLPEVKGFSERNIKLMTQFHREYPSLGPIGQPSVAQLAVPAEPRVILPQPAAKSVLGGNGQPIVAQLPWAHNVLLMQKVKDLPTRYWY